MPQHPPKREDVSKTQSAQGSMFGAGRNQTRTNCSMRTRSCHPSPLIWKPRVDERKRKRFIEGRATAATPQATGERRRSPLSVLEWQRRCATNRHVPAMPRSCEQGAKANCKHRVRVPKLWRLRLSCCAIFRREVAQLSFRCA